jgi:hypothetical protein
MLSPPDWYASLPTVYASACILLTDPHDHVLLVKPGYRDQVGLNLRLWIGEEENRLHTESPGHRLDQAFLRVLGLAVAKLPDSGVREPLTGELLDQRDDLGVGVLATASGVRCLDESVDLAGKRAQRRLALRAARSLTRHH